MKRVVTRGVLVLAIVLATAVTVLIGGAGQAWAATCTDAQLIPRVAEIQVSQGAPNYARFARGKAAIVRAYLTNPTTCTPSNKQSISPVSATLDVRYGASLPFRTLQNYAPMSGKLTAATQVAPLSDPYFVVSESDFAPVTNLNSFDMTFTLKVKYTRNTSATQFETTPTERMITVDKQTNALRVLVVPMGDPTSTQVQWSTAAQAGDASSETRLQNIMANASRALPVPQGVIPELRSTATEGLRYVISSTLLDVKSLNLYTNGKFCANGANWNNTSLVTSGPLAGQTLKSQLLQRFSDYNSRNVPPADLVLGVIDGSIAWKTTDGIAGGCDDGRATAPDPATRTPGQVGWVRLSTDSYPSPVQMELLHTLGIVDPNVSASFHSPSVEADAATNKGYNVTQRKVVATAAGATLGTNDHSLMNYVTTSIPYTKDNTLLEPRDWLDALCDLGGIESQTPTPFATCTLSSALGTNEGVAGSNVVYQISGDITGGTVDVSYAEANVPGDEEIGVAGASSPLHLVLCAGPCATATNVRKDVGLAIFPDEGHTSTMGGFDFNLGDGFDAQVVMDTAMTHAQLRLNGVPVFDANGLDPVPDITSTTATTATEGGTILRSFQPREIVDEFTFPICCGGRAIAFDGTDLYITVAGYDGTDDHIYRISTEDGVGRSQPVRDPDTDSADSVSIGALAYNAASDHLYGGNNGYASDLDDPDTGDIYELDYNNPGTNGVIPRELKFNFDDPDCSDNDRFGSLEYLPNSGNVAVSETYCDTVFLKTLSGGAVSQFGSPDMRGITTDGANGLWLARLEPCGEECSEWRLVHTELDGDVLGSMPVPDPDYYTEYQPWDLAYDSVTFAPACAVWMNEDSSEEPTVQAVQVPCGAATGGQATVTTTDARFVRAFFTCGDPDDPADEQFPLATGLKTTGTVTFDYWDRLFCSVGTPRIITDASNGWSAASRTDPQARVTVQAPLQKPTANIVAPLNNAVFRVGETIHYEGNASDHDQQAIVSGLRWYLDNTLISEGNGLMAFDKLAPTAVGTHVIKLEATDDQGNKGSTTVTIKVLPKACSSTSNC